MEEKGQDHSSLPPRWNCLPDAHVTLDRPKNPRCTYALAFHLPAETAVNFRRASRCLIICRYSRNSHQSPVALYPARSAQGLLMALTMPLAGKQARGCLMLSVDSAHSVANPTRMMVCKSGQIPDPSIRRQTIDVGCHSLNILAPHRAQLRRGMGVYRDLDSPTNRANSQSRIFRMRRLPAAAIIHPSRRTLVAACIQTANHHSQAIS